MKRSVFLAVLLLSICLLYSLTLCAQTYYVINISDSRGRLLFPGAHALNNSGQVVGTASTHTGEFHAFLWTPEGGMIDLGTLPGGSLSSPSAINESGQVAGDSAMIANRTTHAFLWADDGGMVDLGTLGIWGSVVSAMNNAGQVVGRSYTADGERAFRWTAARGMINLGTLPGASSSQPSAINDRGQVVGRASFGCCYDRAVLWNPDDVMVDLGTFPGVSLWGASACGINNSGQVVGISHGVTFWQHAFLWSAATGMIDLGTLSGNSGAMLINDSGQVAGYSYTAAGPPHAVMWTAATGMFDLGAPPTKCSWPWDMNESGQVVGDHWPYVDDGSEPGGFLWTAADGFVDLNSRIIGPAGIRVNWADKISDTGLILAMSNAGRVLLSKTPPAAPVLGPITANDPAAIQSTVSVSVGFMDVHSSDMHTAVWAWGDGSRSTGEVSESNGSGTISGSHVYRDAGSYTVTVAVSDSTGRTTALSRTVEVYDPSGGFVRGAGWISSPAGAFKQDTNLPGLARFNFVSMPRKDSTLPAGKVEFQFHAARLIFQSDNYDWAAVVGGRAQYAGKGTVNGSGPHNFLLTAIDGDLMGGRTPWDRFRIKIWHYDEALKQDVVVYDNQLDSGAVGTAREGTVLGGGSILIHAK